MKIVNLFLLHQNVVRTTSWYSHISMGSRSQHLNYCLLMKIWDWVFHIDLTDHILSKLFIPTLGQADRSESSKCHSLRKCRIKTIHYRRIEWKNSPLIFYVNYSKKIIQKYVMVERNIKQIIIFASPMQMYTISIWCYDV